MIGDKMRPIHQSVVLLLFLFFFDLSSGLCVIKKEVIAACHTFEDVKHINTYNLHTLQASPSQKRLNSDILRNFTSLRYLDLSKGVLKKIEPGSFARLNDLITLNLAANQIEDLKLGTFKGLKRLQTLNLGQNAITQLPPELISLKSLKFLDIAGNPLNCNCASLKIRDLLVSRGVKIMKKPLCYGPVGLKSVSITKPKTHSICMFEEQDDQMQMDQPLAVDGSGDEGSGDDYDEDYSEEDDETNIEESSSKKSITTNETPAPSFEKIPESSTTSLQGQSKSTTVEEIFFDSEETDKRTQSLKIKSTESTTSNILKSTIEEIGSGEIDDEGSGLEGSGTGVPHIDWSKIQEETSEENFNVAMESSSTTSGESLFDMLWGVFWTTAAPEEKKEPNLEEEQFIHVTPKDTGDSIEEEIVPRIVDTAVSTTLDSEKDGSFERTIPPPQDTNPVDESGKLTNIDKEMSQEMGDVSSARQSKKGMGSYVVLAALLAVLAGLIGFAAYKGDFCRNKRKRNDVENGTELKDMQKSLLDANMTQPKIASNGNTEIVPLVNSKPVEDNHEEVKTKNGIKTSEEAKDFNDVVKPPRKSINLQEDSDNATINGTNHQNVTDHSSNLPNSTETITPLHLSTLQTMDRPPISPGAQRVKITLQENPDSVPKTPVLITRVKGDESLVKTP